MVTVNSVQLIGNLTRDPERRAVSSKSSVVGLRLAVNGRRKNKAGAWVQKPSYFDVTVFGNLADLCMEYLAKGRKVAVTGRLDSQQWEKDGQTRSKVEVIANEVEFLSPAPRGAGPEAADTSNAVEEPEVEETASDEAETGAEAEAGTTGSNGGSRRKGLAAAA